jgi:hypothetical protein
VKEKKKKERKKNNNFPKFGKKKQFSSFQFKAML